MLDSILEVLKPKAAKKSGGGEGEDLKKKKTVASVADVARTEPETETGTGKTRGIRVASSGGVARSARRRPSGRVRFSQSGVTRVRARGPAGREGWGVSP